MSCNPYDLCCRYQGQVVQIREQSGREHIGRITRISDNRVWIDPQYDSMRTRNDHSNYYYQQQHHIYPITLGFITGIILVTLFF